MSHKVLLSATYTVLDRLHRDMLEIDGYHHKYSPEEKLAGFAKAIQRAKIFTSKRSIDSLDSISSDDSPSASKEKKKLEEEELKKEEKRKEREAKRRKEMENQRELEKDIIEMMGFDRDII
jgi:DNA-binding LacI/PurR family transcriptional regulator